VNHALFLTDLALQSSGAGFLPSYDVVVIDEAHTFEGVASEHLGLRVTDSQIEYHLSRLFNARTRKGLLAYHRLGEAIQQAHAVRMAAEAFFGRVVEWLGRHGAPNGRLRSKLPLTESLSDELMRLAAAIGRGAEQVESPEQQIELTAAQERCESLAFSLHQWL